MANRRFEAVFIDFFGTLVTGDREAVESTCARIVSDHALPLTTSILAEMWGRCFFAEIEQANGQRFKNLFDCECDSLAATLRDLRDTMANLKAFSQEIKERPYGLVRIRNPPQRRPGDPAAKGDR